MPGTYTLRLTATDTLLTNWVDVVVIANTPPVITVAWTNMVWWWGPGGPWTNGFALWGAVVDDGLPSGTLAVSWSQVSGPGPVAMLFLYALDWDHAGRSERVEIWDNMSTNLLASQDLSWFDSGRYQGWCLKGNVQIKVIRTGGPNAVMSGLFFDPWSYIGGATYISNTPPVILSLSNQTVIYPNSASLSATVTDDGLPGSGLTYAWGKYSGPSTVSFSNANVASTACTFGSTGTYVLCLSASDGELTSFKYTTITVEADNDNDGLPDSWEYQYFGDLSQGPNDDFNGDGITNLQHYQNHSDPTALRIEITQPPPAGNLP